MNRADLIETLAVERHAPSPRPPEFAPVLNVGEGPSAPVSQVLLDAWSEHATVIKFGERRAG